VFHSIGSGPFSSGYLTSLLSQTDFQFVENRDNFTIVELPRVAADAFPAVLDFIYSQGALCNGLEKDPAITLGALYVADYLDVPALRWKCRAVIDEKLNKENLHEYYTLAATLKQVKTIRKIEEMVVDNITHFTPESSIWKILTVESMMEIVGSDKYFLNMPQWKEKGRSIARRLSKFVLSFASHNHEQNGLTMGDFALLTQDEYLSIIHPSVAIQLIELESIICGIDLGSPQQTSLRCRCFNTLARRLKDVNLKRKATKKAEEHNQILDFLRRCHSSIVIDMLTDKIHPPSPSMPALQLNRIVDWADGSQKAWQEWNMLSSKLSDSESSDGESSDSE
jgi:BTB/POZ domain